MRFTELKTILIALLLHGVFTVAVPYSILQLTAQLGWLQFDLGTQIAGWIVIALGALLYIWAGYELLHVSDTSATPLDEPTRLRTEGLYRWSRNPKMVSQPNAAGRRRCADRRVLGLSIFRASGLRAAVLGLAHGIPRLDRRAGDAPHVRR